MKELLLKRFCESPLEFAMAFGILVIAVAVAVKIAGNPIPYIIDRLSSLIPIAVKELKFQAGATGLINLAISFFVFIIAITLILKSNLLSFLLPEDFNNELWGLLVFIISVGVFIFSLRTVSESERMHKLF